MLAEIESLSQAGEIDAAIGRVIGVCEDLLGAARWQELDALLGRADVTKLDAATALSFLSMTLVEKSRLHARPGFIERLRGHLLDSRTPTDVGRLLKGLE